MKEPMVCSSTRRAERARKDFLDVRRRERANPHKLIITLFETLFHDRAATNTPFKLAATLTPVQMMAWTISFSGLTPRRLTRHQGIHRRGQAGAESSRGRHGLETGDQIITVAIEKRRSQVHLHSYRGGGEVAVQWSASTRFASTTPIEAVAQWRAGSLRPLLRVRLQPCPTRQDHKTMSWYDIPTCKEHRPRRRVPDAARHFMAGGVSAEQVAYYVDLLKKVRETPDWKSFLETGRSTRRLERKGIRDWVAREEARHILLMREAGFWRDEVPRRAGRSLARRR